MRNVHHALEMPFNRWRVEPSSRIFVDTTCPCRALLVSEVSFKGKGALRSETHTYDCSMVMLAGPKVGEQWEKVGNWTQ
eukprot:5294297-Pyramimonas_sp.AAC.1